MAWVAEELRGAARPRALRASRPRTPGGGSSCARATRRFVAIVQALAAWREREAQRRDLPRARIIRDDLLMEVAANRPQSVEELRALDRVNLDRESAAGVVAAIRGRHGAAQDEPCRAVPEPVVLPRGIGPTVDLLRVLLKYRSEESDVAQRLLASTADLEAIAVDDEADVPALHGWRREIFGEDALALKAGRMALAVRDRKPVVIRLDASRLSHVLVVGRGFIGRAVAAPCAPGEARLVDHDAAAPARTCCAASAPSCSPAGNPASAPRPGTLGDDLELALGPTAAAAHGQLRQPRHAQGLRAVDRPRSARPTAWARPTSTAGRSWRSSTRWPRRSGPRLTRLRLANIFGYERIAGAHDLPEPDAGGPGAARRDPLRHEPVRPPRLPAGRARAPRWLADSRAARPAGMVNVGSGVALRSGGWRCG